MRLFSTYSQLFKEDRPQAETISISTYSKFTGISILVLGSLCYLFPFYYDKGTESHFKIITSGVFSGKPQGIFNSFGTHIQLDKWRAFFYTYFPSIDWNDISIVILNGILLGQLFLLLTPFLKKKTLPSFLLFFAAIVFISQSFIQQDPLPLSLLLCSTSMLLILNFRLSKILYAWILFIFLLGLFVRIESGVLAVLIVTLSDYLYKGVNKRQFRNLFIFYAILLSVLVLVNLPINKEDADYLKMRPYQFALWDYYNKYPEVQVTNLSDSVIFYSATQAFMTDKTKTNEAFYRKIKLNSTDKTPKDFLNYIVKIPYQLNRAVDYFNEFVLHQKLLWLSLFFMIGVVIIYYQRTLATIIVAAGIFSMLAVISVIMKMETHLFLSLLSLLVLLVFYYSQYTSKISPKSIHTVWFVIALLLSCLYITTSTVRYIGEKSAYAKAMQLTKIELSQLPKSSIVFLDLATTIHWYSYLFEKEIPMQCTILPLDNGLIYMTQSHQDKLMATFGCNEFPCYMDKFLDMKGAYYLTVPERKEILETYMKVVYHQPIDFEAQFTVDLKENRLVPPITLYAVSKLKFPSE
ncbi:MAG: hypothetical protein M9887_11510 [Chitinophagales bacterium]|nr:hypothetical protein [Chitinophagales bacterium]